MPQVQDTDNPLADFTYNRREVYANPSNDQDFAGNRDVPMAPDVTSQILQPLQTFLPGSIPSQALGTYDTGNAGVTSDGNATSSIRGWAGATFANRNTAPFRYDQAGNVWATAIFIGSSSTIAGFSIGADYIKDAADSFGLASTVTGGNDIRFWAGSTFANRTTAATFAVYENGYMTLGNPASTYIQVDGPNNRIQSSDYITGVSGFRISPALIEAENIKARGTLKGATFQYDVVSAVGGQLMVSNADNLATDMTALDASTLTVSGASTFSVNDIILIRATTASGIQEEWLRITNVGSAPIYTVTRDLAAAYAPDSNPVWIKGTTIVKQGKSDGAAVYSGGWLRLFGEGTNSPYYSVYSRTGLSYNNYTEAVRLGNLNGIGGFVSDTYGIFIGNYSTGKYMTYDTVSSNLVINGFVAITKGAFGGDGSDGALTVTSGTTTMDVGGVAVFTKNYSSISITGTGKVVFINPHPNGTIIILKVMATGSVTLTSSAAIPILDASGMGASAGAAATGGAITTNGVNGAIGSADLTVLDLSNHYGNFGTQGLYNATSTSAAGGASATVNSITGPANLYSALSASNLYRRIIYLTAGAGGASGGSGGGSTGSTGGASGAGGLGGGGLYIECAGSWNFTITNGISVAGKNGSVGANATVVDGTKVGAGGGGGGGGGAGGTFLALYNTLTSNTGTVNVTGGTGGNGGVNTTGAAVGATGNGGGGGGGGASFGAGGAGGTGSYGSVNNNAIIGAGGGGGGASSAGTDGTNATQGTGGGSVVNGGRGGGGGGGGGGISLISLNLFFF